MNKSPWKIKAPKGNTNSVTVDIWISKDDEVDKEIDLETRQFLNELEESKKSDRLLVGWKPD